MKNKIFLIIMLVLGVSMLSFSGNKSREQGIQKKKAALEREYQRCMKNSRYKENCNKYREIQSRVGRGA